jgi:ATP-dependent RNA helicase DeaD
MYVSLVEALAEEHDPLQVAAAAIYLANGGPSGRHDDVPAAEQEERGPASEGGMIRLHLDTGREHGVRPQDLVAAFTQEAGIEPSAIGTIDMFGDFTLVELRRKAASTVLERTPVLQMHGREVHVTRAREKGEVKGPRPARSRPAAKRPFRSR